MLLAIDCDAQTEISAFKQFHFIIKFFFLKHLHTTLQNYQKVITWNFRRSAFFPAFSVSFILLIVWSIFFSLFLSLFFNFLLLLSLSAAISLLSPSLFHLDVKFCDVKYNEWTEYCLQVRKMIFVCVCVCMCVVYKQLLQRI